MTEKEFKEHKRQFRILSKTKWRMLDKFELESIFHESLAKAYLNYDSENATIKFSTYLYHIYNRDIYLNLIRPKKYVKNQLPIVDIQSTLQPDEELDNYFVDKFQSTEQTVLFNELITELKGCIEEFIDWRLSLYNCKNTKEEYETAFKMLAKEYDVKSISVASNMSEFQIHNLTKSFRKKYRNNFKIR